MNTQEGSLSFAVQVDTTAMEQDLNRATLSFKKLGDMAADQGDKIQNSLSKIGKMLPVHFSLQALNNFAQSVIRVRGEIESLEISFETLLGSKDKADKLFGAIREFAANTPMTMNSLASGAQTLLGFGIEAEKVMPILQQIGDISMGDAQKFNSLTLAFAQASSAGKLAGQDFLQMVNAGFNPLNEMAKATGKSIKQLKQDMEDGKITTSDLEKAFASATAEGGMFHGMLQKQSSGIQGALSNLQGAWDDMLNDIGSKQQSVFVDGVNLLTDLIKNYEPFLNAILSVAAAYGIYKAALMAVWVVEKARALAENIQLIMMFRKELGLLTAAQQAFNNTAWANPYVLLAAAILGICAALYLYTERTTDAEAAQNKLNESRDELHKSIEDERTRIDELINIVQSKMATDYAQIKAYEELKKLCPQLTDAYSREKLAVTDLTNAKKILNQIDEQKEYDGITAELNEYEEALNDLIASEKEYGNYRGVSSKTRKLINDLGITGQGIDKAINQFSELYIKPLRDIIEEIDTIRAKAAEEAIPLKQRIEIQTTVVSDAQKAFDEAKKKLDAAQKQYETEPTLWNKLIQVKCQWAFDWNLGQLNDAESKMQNLIGQQPKTYAAAFEEAKKAYTEAYKLVQTMKKNRKNYTQKEWVDAQEKLKDTQKEFTNLGGEAFQTKSSSQLANEAKQRAKKIADMNRELQSLRVEGALKIESLELQVMEDGMKKRLQQIEIDRRSQVAAIEKQREQLVAKLKELKISLPKDVAQQFADQITSINTAAAIEVKRTERDNAKYIENLYREIGNVFATEEQRKLSEIKQRYAEQREQLKKDRDGGNLTEQQFTDLTAQSTAAEAREMENYWLDTYGDYYQKRKTLQETWEANLANIPAQYAAEARKMMQRKLTELDLTELKKNLNWEEVFGNLDRVSTASLRSLKTKLQEFIKTQKDLSPENAKALADAIEKIDDKINERNPFETISTSFASLKTATGNLKKAQDEYNVAVESGTDAERANAEATLNAARNAKQKALVDATKSIQAACGRMQEYIAVASSLSEMLSSFGIDIPPELSGFIEGIGNALDGLQGIDLTKPTTILTGFFKTITGIGKAIGSLFNHDSSKQKKIENWQRQIEALQRAYTKLDDAIKDAYSSDASKLINQQNELLNQQKILIQNQIVEEEAKKNSDNDKINTWRQQLEEIDRQISDNNKAAIDAIFGQDIKSAIENFADAYADAWANGESRALTARDTVREMMQNMVKESIKAAIQSSGAMERIRKTLMDYYQDGILSMAEQANVYKMAEELQKELDARFGDQRDLLYGDSFTQSASVNTWQGMSAEDAGVLQGRFTALAETGEQIRQINTEISQSIKNQAGLLSLGNEILQDTLNIHIINMGHLEDISKNTRGLADFKETLNKIERHVRNL